MKRLALWIQSWLIRYSPDRKLYLDILLEICILGGVYLIYSVSRGSLAEKASVAFSHAQDIIDLEKAMGIFFEPDIQGFFLQSSLRMEIANSLYTYCYYPPLVLFAIWAYWRHRRKYKIVRTCFVISAILAFIVFATYPLAPPRFFDGTVAGVPDLGFVDTLHTHWGVDDKSVNAFYNPYAAMPSLHQGWTLMIGTGIIWMTRSWFGRVIGVLLPAAMFVGIVSTANHFILDAVGGALVLVISILLTRLIVKYLGKYHHQENGDGPSAPAAQEIETAHNPQDLETTDIKPDAWSRSEGT